MIRFGLFICSILVSLEAFSVEVKWFEMDNAEMEIELNLTPEELTLEKVKSQGRTFSRLPIHGEGFQTGREGLPETPLIHRWLAVSDKSQYRIEIVPGNYKTYHNVLLYPAQADVLESEKPTFVLNQKAYLQNRWYGSSRVTLGRRGKLGSVTIFPISFSPAAYHPVKRELRVYENLRVRLIRVDETLKDEEPQLVSQFAAEQVAQLTLNGDVFLNRQAKVARSKKVLIVYGPAHQKAAEEIAQLYQGQGLGVYKVEALAGLKPAALKEVLNVEYQKWNLDAVLLLGDEVSIPLKDSSGKAGDYSYSLVSGTDQISDIAIGRYPIKNAVQSQIIVNKLKRYQALYQAGYRNKKVMLIAHHQNYPGKYTGNLESIRKSANPKNLEFNTQYGGEEAKNTTVIAEAQKGYAIINYRGHGSASSWSGWGSDGASFSANQVKSLPDSETSLSFIFNVACTNGAIQNSSPVIVEKELFPNEDPASLQGAVSAFGATAPSLTEVNHRFNSNLFEYLQSDTEVSIGSVYTLANNKLTKDNGGSATSNTRMYILFSDPLLIPWIQ